MCKSFLAALPFLLISTVLAQQPPQLEDSQSGEIFLTPQVDLVLEPVSLTVPEKFKGQSQKGKC